MQSSSTRNIDVENIEHSLPIVDNAKMKAVVISSVIAMIIAVGMLLKPQKYEAFVLINYNPVQIEDQWDLLRDESRVVDFEGQFRSRAVLAPVLKQTEFKSETPGLLERWGFSGSAVTEELNQEQREAALIENFQDELRVERIEHSSILRVGVKMTDAHAAAKTANGIVQSFFDLKRREFLDRAQERLVAMDDEIKDIQDELSEVMKRRALFLTQNGWDDYDAEMTSATNQVALLKQELSRLENSSTGASPNTQGDRSSAFDSRQALNANQQDDANLNRFIQERNEIDARYMEIKSRYKKDSPPVLQIAREKKMLEDSIEEYLERRKHMIVAQLKSWQSKLQDLSNAASEMQSFHRIIEHAEKRHQELMSQRSSIRIQVAAIQNKSDGFGDLRVLDRAVAPKSSGLSSAKYGITILAAFFVSFFLLMIVFEVWNQAFFFISDQHRQSLSSPNKML